MLSEALGVGLCFFSLSQLCMLAAFQDRKPEMHESTASSSPNKHQTKSSKMKQKQKIISIKTSKVGSFLQTCISDFKVNSQWDRNVITSSFPLWSAGVRFGGKSAVLQLSELLCWEPEMRVFVGFVILRQSRKTQNGSRNADICALSRTFYLLCFSVMHHEVGCH